MATANLFMRVGNNLNKIILQSPFHGMLSRNTVMISFPGCKSGRMISTPVNFIQIKDMILVTSLRDRTWWRNLRGGKYVTLDLRGKKETAYAEVLEDPIEVTKGLEEFLTGAPSVAKYFKVATDTNARWNQSQLEQASSSRVIIKLKLPDPDPK